MIESLPALYTRGLVFSEIPAPFFLIKSYEAADMPRLVSLYDQLILTRAGAASIHSRFVNYPTKDELESRIAGWDTKYIGIVEGLGNEVLGWGDYSIVDTNPETAYMARLLAPQAQGKGIGTTLARHLIDTCVAQHPDVKNIEAETDIDNKAATRSLLKAASAYDITIIEDRQHNLITSTIHLR